MSKLDLDDLQAVAEEAIAENAGVCNQECLCGLCLEEKFKFHEIANPTTVLALIAQAREAERLRERYDACHRAMDAFRWAASLLKDALQDSSSDFRRHYPSAVQALDKAMELRDVVLGLEKEPTNE